MHKSIYRFTLLFIASATWVNAQSVSSVTVTGNTVRCMLSNGSAVDFSPATESMVRVEYRQGNQNSKMSEVMDSAYVSTLAFSSANTSGDPITLAGPNYSVSIAKSPFGIVFKNASGTTLFTSSSVGQYTLNGTVISGNYYGVRNATYHDNQNYPDYIFSGSQDLYDNLLQGRAVSPFLWTTKRFGILVDQEEGNFTLNGTTLQISRNTNSANTNCLFWLISGTPQQIMAGYYKATGFFPVLPRWTCGFMNSQWCIDETELKTIIQMYRSKSIPIDAFILDLDWFAYENEGGVVDGDFKWSPSRFPSATTNFTQATGGDLKRWCDGQGLKIVGIRKPHGAFNGFVSGGDLGTNADFNDPAIRKIFWDKFTNPSWDCYARGIIEFWNDEADWGPGPLEFMNMQRSLYDGVRYATTTSNQLLYHNNRVWSINRNYVGGAQKYAYGLWSGDIDSSTQTMQDNRKFMLGAAAVGAAWWGMDIGGFWGHPSNADYLHWMQLGAFAPIYRVHCVCGEKRQPWLYGTDAERVGKMYISLRMTLVPYIYSGFWKLHRDGIPLVRPLVMDYPDDANVAATFDAWMFGDNMLVSPVVTNYSATTKSVYLPQGNWVNFWTDAVYAGGSNVTIPVSLDSIPVLVKQGAVIPRQAVVQYINNYPITQNTNNAIVPVTFHVYGGANGSFEYFDDDGVTYNYEKGQYRAIVYTHTSSASDEQVAIGAGTGSYTPTDSSGYFVFHGISWAPVFVSVQSGDISSKQVAATALSATAAPAWAYDATKKQAFVKVASPFAAGVISIASTTGIKIPSTVALGSKRIMIRQGQLHIPITFTGNHGLTVRLITGSGAVAREYRFTSLPQGDQTLSLAAGNLAAGICFVSLSSGENSVLKKILMVR
jgi:alpha-glucosidase